MPQCTMVTEYNEFHGNNDEGREDLLIVEIENIDRSIVLNREEIDSLYLFLINNYSHILSHYWKDANKEI